MALRNYRLLFLFKHRERLWILFAFDFGPTKEKKGGWYEFFDANEEGKHTPSRASRLKEEEKGDHHSRREHDVIHAGVDVLSVKDLRVYKGEEVVMTTCWWDSNSITLLSLISFKKKHVWRIQRATAMETLSRRTPNISKTYTVWKIKSCLVTYM